MDVLFGLFLPKCTVTVHCVVYSKTELKFLKIYIGSSLLNGKLSQLDQNLEAVYPKLFKMSIQSNSIFGLVG